MCVCVCEGKGIRFIRSCTHENPPGDIPEQLAAYSAHALSTALFLLGTHFAAG